MAKAIEDGKAKIEELQKMSKEDVLLDEKQKKGDYWFNMYQNRPESGCLAIPLSEYVCDDSASKLVRNLSYHSKESRKSRRVLIASVLQAASSDQSGG